MACEHNYELADVASDFPKLVCTKCGDTDYKSRREFIARCLPGEHDWIEMTVLGQPIKSHVCGKCNQRK